MILNIYDYANTVLSLEEEKCNDHLEREYLSCEIHDWEVPNL
jgi:hypothetical protein